MLSPDTISKNTTTGIISFYEGGFVVASCKETSVIQPILAPDAKKNKRGFRVFTGAPAPSNPEATIRYDYFDFGIDNLAQVVVASTVYSFTPPSLLPVNYDPNAYATAYNSVFSRLTSSVFQSCCDVTINIPSDGTVTFVDTYADLPVTGLSDVLYVVKDGSGTYMWNSVDSVYEPVYYPHPSITMYALQNFI